LKSLSFEKKETVGLLKIVTWHKIYALPPFLWLLINSGEREREGGIFHISPPHDPDLNALNIIPL